MDTDFLSLNSFLLCVQRKFRQADEDDSYFNDDDDDHEDAAGMTTNAPTDAATSQLETAMKEDKEDDSFSIFE